VPLSSKDTAGDSRSGQGDHGSGNRPGIGWRLPGRYLTAARRAGRVWLVASDPTVSRTLDQLATDASAALTVINTARAAARVWELAGENPPHAGI
jgi:hypothetical protein